MGKVGLKDTLVLLAKGYTKKEIDALAAIDEEQEAPAAPEAKKEPEAPAPSEDKKAPDDAAAKESNPEPDYKKELEEKQKELDEIKETLKKLQQDNVHKNAAPEAEKAKEEQAESLTNLVRSFM